MIFLVVILCQIKIKIIIKISLPYLTNFDSNEIMRNTDFQNSKPFLYFLSILCKHSFSFTLRINKHIIFTLLNMHIYIKLLQESESYKMICFKLFINAPFFTILNLLKLSQNP